MIAKGRRFGLTYGFANYVIESMVSGVSPVLWVDTINSNIDRYIERYFIPTLNQLPRELWEWRQQKKELRVINSICDFRSAEHPESIEGFGYALIVLNEAGIILNDSYLWYNAIRPMILDYSALMLIGGTPKGKKQKRKNEPALFYELFKKGLEGGDTNWKSFQFSTYDNPYLLVEEIDELVKTTPPLIRRQEINGEFVDMVSGEVIRREWWKYYREPPNFNAIYQSYDTGFKVKEENDPSCCHTYGVTDTDYYLIDRWCERVEFPELKRQVVALYNKYKPIEVLIEDKASGQSLIQELRQKTNIPIKPIQVDKDKLARANAVTPTIEAGKVWLPENAPWLADFLDSTSDFPYGVHDEDVDCLSQFINYMRRKEEPRVRWL